MDTGEWVRKRGRMGADNPSWKGDGIGFRSGHARARRIYREIGSCVKCGAEKTERHHKDGNTANNHPTNVEVLCRRCHMQADGRLDKLRNRTPEQIARTAAALRKGSTFFCLLCSVHFWRMPYQIAQGKNKFCSVECTRAYWREYGKVGN